MPTDPSTPQRWHDPALLDHLERARKPWDAPVRRAVTAVLARFLPSPAASLVEIGAGGGQLRDWLPRELLSATTHTEPSEPFLSALRDRHPEAKVVRADAVQLPFADGSASAVLGLCVVDAVPDLAAVRDECRRVLRPGGGVVHFLDLSTNPDAAFAELIAAGELPLPNFAAEPTLLEALTDARKALLPPADEFDEVLAVGWEAFSRFVGMLESSRHPLAADLGPYSRLREPGRLDPDRLAQGFIATRGDSAALYKLNKALLALTLTARGLGREWPLRAVSLRSHLRERLRSAFSGEDGFAVEFAGPVAAREALPDGSPWLLRHAGRTVTRTEPTPIPGKPVEELEGVAVAPLTAGAVRATTVEVFVARKLPTPEDEVRS